MVTHTCTHAAPFTRSQRSFKSIHDYNTDSYVLAVPGDKALVIYQV
jgi:hypothetical protein